MIRIELDVMLARRKMTLTELSRRLDIALPNLSILKNGHAKAIRMALLDALCRELDCQPGELLVWEPDDAAEKEQSSIEKKGLVSSAYAEKTSPVFVVRGCCHSVSQKRRQQIHLREGRGENQRSELLGRMTSKVEAHKLFQNFVAFQSANHAAGRIVAGDIRRIAGNNIADELSNRVIALGLQGVVDIQQDVLRFIAGFLNGVQLGGFKLTHSEASFLRRRSIGRTMCHRISSSIIHNKARKEKSFFCVFDENQMKIFCGGFSFLPGYAIMET